MAFLRDILPVVALNRIITAKFITRQYEPDQHCPAFCWSDSKNKGRSSSPTLHGHVMKKCHLKTGCVNDSTRAKLGLSVYVKKKRQDSSACKSLHA